VLQRSGFQVTLVDRCVPQRAAAWGNAGHFAYEQILPLAQPGLWSQLPRMLLSPDGPLRIPPASWFGLGPWLLRFAWSTRPSQVQRASAALAGLLGRAREAWERLAEGAQLRALIKTSPILLVARDAATMRAKRPLMQRYRRQGIRVEELDANAARGLEPALRADIAGAFSYADGQYTTDPGALLAELVARFAACGGRVVGDEVRVLRRPAEGGVSLVCAARTVQAAQCVLAAGAGSGALLSSLGVRLPLAAERGYHLMVPNPGVRLPILGARPEFVITPMASGLRLAGTVELARCEAPPCWRRATLLQRLAEELLGPLEVPPDAPRWMGCRPSFPDSLPVIGRLRSAPELILAFGHQHIGLTLAAITAELVASVVSNSTPSVELAPFSAERFA
jgi:D-amino-acid dehydrogenase